MPTKNQEFGRRWFEEIWNKQRRDAIDEMMHPDAVVHEGGQDTVGADAFRRFYDEMQSMFSNLHITVNDVIGEGDTICVRWTCWMTHTGPAFGIEATGRTAETTGITIFRIADGKAVEGWQNWDMMAVVNTLGADPMQKNALAVAAYSST